VRGQDRWIAIAVTSDEAWRALVGAMGDPAWATAQALASLDGRLAELDTIHEQIATWTAGFDDYELAERLQSAGVAATPVLNVADLLRDPHYRAPRHVHRGHAPARLQGDDLRRVREDERSTIEVRTGRASARTTSASQGTARHGRGALPHARRFASYLLTRNAF
jgi:crotonobetainyl-CoA:carnitine CoA-transferase CaiB-like acyl-CoA transferase